MGAEKTKKVQDNESKADKFVRLGEYRVNKVIDAIGRLENLFNRTNYEYTQEQVEVMFFRLVTLISFSNCFILAFLPILLFFQTKTYLLFPFLGQICL